MVGLSNTSQSEIPVVFEFNVLCVLYQIQSNTIKYKIQRNIGIQSNTFKYNQIQEYKRIHEIQWNTCNIRNLNLSHIKFEINPSDEYNVH